MKKLPSRIQTFDEVISFFFNVLRAKSQGNVSFQWLHHNLLRNKQPKQLQSKKKIQEEEEERKQEKILQKSKLTKPCMTCG